VRYRLCKQSTRRFPDGKDDGIYRYIGAAYSGKEEKEESENAAPVDNRAAGSLADRPKSRHDRENLSYSEDFSRV
jgi:hypothetical protein